VIVLALTLRSLTSTLFPQRTMGIPSQTRVRSPKRQNGSSAGDDTVPVGDVFVGDAGGDVEHDDTALAWDVSGCVLGRMRVPWM